jgi:predicted dehydrogenase
VATKKSKHSKLGVALVGCGDFSEQHIQGCQRSRHVRLVKVMDVNPRAAERFKEKYQVPATTAYDEVLRDPAVDIVIIAVPHYLHKPLTIQAARAGKHVLCEKPIATTAADAREMIETCRRRKVKLCIGFGGRRWGTVGRARELLRQGVIGDLMLISIPTCGYKHESYWHEGYTHVVTTDWRASKVKSGGGFFIMNISHTLDMLRYLTGMEYTSAQGTVATMRTDVEVEDLGCAIWRMTNGALVNAFGGTMLPGKRDERALVSLYGTAGRMELGWPLRVFTTKKTRGFNHMDWTEITPEHKKRHGWTPLIEQFALAIINNTEPPITGHDGLKTLQAVLGVYESSRTGRTVRLP